MRTLYHFPTSPFSRAARLALAHKALDAELRDGRAHPEFHDEAKKLHPLRTVPVLVDEGRVVGGSVAIAHYVDLAYAGPKIFPGDPDDAAAVLRVVELVSGALDRIVDVGTRYFSLRKDAEWKDVRDEQLGRVQAALDALAETTEALGRPTIAKAGWSAGDMWLYAATEWMEAWPGRASSNPRIAQILTLGIRVPAPLSRWADRHRGRADVRALG